MNDDSCSRCNKDFPKPSDRRGVTWKMGRWQACGYAEAMIRPFHEKCAKDEAKARNEGDAQHSV